jgi:hypothetical protein
MSRRIGLALMVLGAALLLAPSSASAASLEAAGWWWRPQTSALPVPLPAPPTVQKGQLLVEGQPQGANAVAALRFNLGDGEGSPVLTLKPAANSAVPPDAVVLACRALVSWSPEEVGPWENKPLVDCATSVQGIPGEGGVLTFALAPLQSETVLDVVLVPGTVPSGPPGANGSTFSMVLDRPGPDALHVDASAPPTGGDFSSSADSFSSAPAAGSFDAGPSAAFAAPSDSFTPPAAAPAASGSLTPNEQAPSVANRPAPVPFSDGYDNGTRALGLVVFAIGAAFALQSIVRSRGASAIDATESVGGLGRFARARVGTPPPLS